MSVPRKPAAQPAERLRARSRVRSTKQRQIRGNDSAAVRDRSMLTRVMAETSSRKVRDALTL